MELLFAARWPICCLTRRRRDREHPRQGTRNLPCFEPIQEAERASEDSLVFIESQATDPAVHNLCITIARRCVWVIQAVLREEERHLAAQEFYRVCREEVGKKPGQEPEV